MSAEPAYKAEGAIIFKASVHTKNADGSTSISVGFPVCEVTDWIGEDQATTVAELLCRGERYDALADALNKLSMLALQSDRYRADADYRDAVDAGLALTLTPSPKPLKEDVE